MAWRVTSTSPLKLVSNTRHHTSASISQNRPKRLMPALLTTMSKAPNLVIAACTSCAELFTMSLLSDTAVPPASVIICTVSSARSPAMSFATTLAPREASMIGMRAPHSLSRAGHDGNPPTEIQFVLESHLQPPSGII